jgi:hypothetical protein
MIPLGVPSPGRPRRALACALGLLVGALAFDSALPAASDHPATEIHVDAAHGPHDGFAAQTDDGLASRVTTSEALPAHHQLLALAVAELVATHGDAPETAPGHPPPRQPPARSPPFSV